MKLKCVWCDGIVDQAKLDETYDADLDTSFCPYCGMGDSYIEIEGEEP